MIAKMSKYNFVLYRAQSEDFIERLRELGLVDITTTGWEPKEEERQLLLSVEGYGKAVEAARQWQSAQTEPLKGEPYATAEEAYAAYNELLQQSATRHTELGKLEKMADELRPWGEFDPKVLERLVQSGVKMRFFFTPASSYEKIQEEKVEGYSFHEINMVGGNVYFVAIGEGEELSIDAQEVRTPSMDIREVESRIQALKAEIDSLGGTYARLVASEELLVEGMATMKERLQTCKVTSTATEEAEGLLLILEGWAEAETSAKVDALLESYPNVVYLKGDPTPEDNTPVKLTNSWYARIFEMVGDMYARPKYGTIDLTPFFAPFYMLFFGICLNDAGYGLILLLLALLILKKNPEPGMMRQAGWFATMCSISTILFGGFCGSFFGLSLGEYLPITFFDFQGKFFSIALAIGIVQIIFGLAINVWGQSRAFGFTSSFGTLGWLIVLTSCALAMGLPMFDMAIPGFTASSPAFYVAVGVGAVLMLLLNNIRRNPLVNFGSGLWDLYNNITGLLSDVLSYIRLFAIGLSGGVLALVFNSLAEGFVPEGANIVVRILVMLPILLIGHGINLFMSTISSFVHPMRLTFVEFYKNAGFEMAARNFEPLKKENQTNK
uniref:V-type ATP synthase subunit I n=1 Tax=Alistipes sp. TaxID=1872444 RepID=UPI0040565DDC